MPPKTCECSICGEIILKAQTYHVGDGKRACKKHEGVIEKANEIQANMKEKAEQEAKEAAEKRRNKFRQYAQESADQGPNPFAPKCFICSKEGLPEQLLWQGNLIAMERLELSGEKFNMFTAEGMEAFRDKHPFKGQRFLFRRLLKKDGTHRLSVFSKIKNRDMRMAAEMAQMIVVCSECLDGVKEHLVNPIADQASTLETMATMSTVYELGIKDGIQEIAKEMERVPVPLKREDQQQPE